MKCFLVDTPYVLTRLSGVAIDKVFDQQGNVFCSFPKRWNLNGENMQAVKQITPERSSANGGLEVPIGGCDDPDVGTDSTTAADTFKLMFLQNAQEGNLGLSWKFSDFVEEDRARTC